MLRVYSDELIAVSKERKKTEDGTMFVSIVAQDRHIKGNMRRHYEIHFYGDAMEDADRVAMGQPFLFRGYVLTKRSVEEAENCEIIGAEITAMR